MRSEREGFPRLSRGLPDCCTRRVPDWRPGAVEVHAFQIHTYAHTQSVVVPLHGMNGPRRIWGRVCGWRVCIIGKASASPTGQYCLSGCVCDGCVYDGDVGEEVGWHAKSIVSATLPPVCIEVAAWNTVHPSLVVAEVSTSILTRQRIAECHPDSL